MNDWRSSTSTTKNKITDRTGKEKIECFLDEENNSLEKPVPGILQSQKRQVGVHLVSFDDLKKYTATHLCCMYPTMSNYGMKYILVLYDYVSNEILAEAMKTNKAQAITDVYDELHTKLTDAGIIPILQYLNNEISKELVVSIKSKNLKYQLAAPHDHRLNPAERAASTFKNHFIVILAGCDERFQI